eukprot:5655452-Pleurochrysis_carterae.AAC.1
MPVLFLRGVHAVYGHKEPGGIRASRRSMSRSRTGSSDAVQLGQNGPSRCLKRRAKFQRSVRSACSGRGAMPTFGLNDKCCNDALQAGLAKGRWFPTQSSRRAKK